MTPTLTLMADTFAQHPTLAIALAGGLGLLVGSFLNVVILRLPPRMEWEAGQEAREVLGLEPDPAPAPPGIARKPSGCPSCGHRIRPWENVPVVSWLLLRGRCSGCGGAISVQYPLVELLTGLLFAAVVWQLGFTAPAAAVLIYTSILVALCGIDLRTMLLPDRLTLPLLWLGLLASAAGLTVPPVEAILGAALGYLSLWGVFQAFRLATGKEAMGYGDFKLLAALGAWCGAWGLLPIILAAALLGAIVGGLWLAVRGNDASAPFAFGPYLAAAGWVQLLWGDPIVGLYRL